MASLFRRKDSPYWFIRYKADSGKWKDKSTGLRINDKLQTAKAKRLKQFQHMREAKMVGHRVGQDSVWQRWVPAYIDEKWMGRTRVLYLHHFSKLTDYFEEMGITHPASIAREAIFGYLGWRKIHGGSKNTALDELGFLRQLLKEAVLRNYCDRNEAASLGIKSEERREKAPWSDEEIRKAGRSLEMNDRFGWLHVTFLFGLYQACRLQQCSIPFEGIDFRRGTITYPSSHVKGGRPFTHRIDPSFRDNLAEICRLPARVTTCDIPERPSLVWRKFLDELGYRHLCHHGLRVTWITRAALAGVPENIAMRFVNHSSSTVHKIYQKFTIEDQAPLLDRLSLPVVSPRNPEAKS